MLGAKTARRFLFLLNKQKFFEVREISVLCFKVVDVKVLQRVSGIQEAQNPCINESEAVAVNNWSLETLKTELNTIWRPI